MRSTGLLWAEDPGTGLRAKLNEPASFEMFIGGPALMAVGEGLRSPWALCDLAGPPTFPAALLAGVLDAAGAILRFFLSAEAGTSGAGSWRVG